jgi:ArsR family transcriptional regulator, lead/cadmium/zinc/bismuth-responsive transcriptional repressor
MSRPTRHQQIAVLPGRKSDEGIVHSEAVGHARAAQPANNDLRQLAALLGLMADPTRLRIIAALDSTELCVCDLSATVGISESAASHHLKLMRELALVRTRRDGRRIYYALDDQHVTSIYRQARDHVRHQPVSGTQP